MRDMRVLIIDDEPAISRVLRPALQGHDFVVATAASGAEGMVQLESFQPDLVLLDLGLPDIDGVDMAKKIREHTDVPVIVLSVREAESDKIAALDGGADDYLTKPFSMGELMARIRVALRHYGQAPRSPGKQQPVEIGSIVLDSERHELTVRGATVHLSPTEFNLLETMMRNAGMLLTHRTLLHKVWGPEYTAETQLLRVYIGQLRGKIEERPERPAYILTEPGIGYRFRGSD